MVGLQYRTFFHIEMVITNLLSYFFLSFFIIYLTVKWFLTNFDFDFFFFFHENSLFLACVLIQNGSLIDVI